MLKSFIQCTTILVLTILLVLAQPSEINQKPFDGHSRSDHQSNEKNTQKANSLNFENYMFTRLFANDFNSFTNCEQPKKINKNVSNSNKNIGAISEKEFKLLCDLVAAEAENQPFEGKRAVVGVVLNRSEHGWPFDEGIEGTIFQEGAFSCISDNRFYDAWQYVSEEDEEAVAAELTERKYSEYLYFTADHYGKYGTPAEQIGDHYFCTE